MAITANWIQAVSYSAKVDRVFVANTFDEGVQRGFATTAGVVTRDVSVAVGVAAIVGDDQANQGTYLVFNDAAATVAIGAAPGSGTRVDLVVLRINDPAAGGPAGSTATLTVVVGTVGAGAPAVPTSAIPICEVSISAGQTVIGTGQVTDRRTWGGQKMPVGTVIEWYGPENRIPYGWAEMTGQVLGTVSAYPDLAELLGLTSGSITLPDARGRVIVTLDSTQTEFDALAETGGAKTVTLGTTEIPSHTHPVNPPATAVSGGTVSAFYSPPGTGTWQIPTTGGPPQIEVVHGAQSTGGTVDIAQFDSLATGGGSAHNNLQPYLVLRRLLRVLA